MKNWMTTEVTAGQGCLVFIAVALLVVVLLAVMSDNGTRQQLRRDPTKDYDVPGQAEWERRRERLFEDVDAVMEDDSGRSLQEILDSRK